MTSYYYNPAYEQPLAGGTGGRTFRSVKPKHKVSIVPGYNELSEDDVKFLETFDTFHQLLDWKALQLVEAPKPAPPVEEKDPPKEKPPAKTSTTESKTTKSVNLGDL